MVQETIEYVAVDLIDLDGNIRGEIDERELDSRMQSMRSVGLLQPARLRAKGGRFTIIDGFGRVICAKRLGWKEIAAIVEGGEMSDQQSLLTALVANCQRANVPDLDVAEAIDRLMRQSGWNASETAAKLGFSNAKVSRLVALLTLPDAIRRQIRAGKIPASAGYELARVGDETEQRAMAEQVAGGKLTRDGLSGVIKALRRSPQGPSTVGAGRVIVPLAEGRSVSISGGIPSLEALINVCQELLAKARKARTQGWTMPTFLKVARDSRG